MNVVVAMSGGQPRAPLGGVFIIELISLIIHIVGVSVCIGVESVLHSSFICGYVMVGVFKVRGEIRELATVGDLSSMVDVMGRLLDRMCSKGCFSTIARHAYIALTKTWVTGRQCLAMTCGYGHLFIERCHRNIFGSRFAGGCFGLSIWKRGLFSLSGWAVFYASIRSCRAWRRRLGSISSTGNPSPISEMVRSGTRFELVCHCTRMACSMCWLFWDGVSVSFFDTALFQVVNHMGCGNSRGKSKKKR